MAVGTRVLSLRLRHSCSVTLFYADQKRVTRLKTITTDKHPFCLRHTKTSTLASNKCSIGLDLLFFFFFRSDVLDDVNLVTSALLPAFLEAENCRLRICHKSLMEIKNKRGPKINSRNMSIKDGAY